MDAWALCAALVGVSVVELIRLIIEGVRSVVSGGLVHSPAGFGAPGGSIRGQGLAPRGAVGLGNLRPAGRGQRAASAPHAQTPIEAGAVRSPRLAGFVCRGRAPALGMRAAGLRQFGVVQRHIALREKREMNATGGRGDNRVFPLSEYLRFFVAGESGGSNFKFWSSGSDV